MAHGALRARIAEADTMAIVLKLSRTRFSFILN